MTSHHTADTGISDISSLIFQHKSTVSVPNVRAGVNKSYRTGPESQAGLGFVTNGFIGSLISSLCAAG